MTIQEIEIRNADSLEVRSLRTADLARIGLSSLHAQNGARNAG